MPPKTASKSYKRIVVACDGTWVNGDDGFVRDSWLPWKAGGHLATPSNVTRICRALEQRSEDGVQQLVYYQAGLGSQNNFFSFFFGGYFGQGISENVREAYAFICNNYEDGDEIFLIGFSRGAFTARSIGGLISSIGLLTKRGLGAFYTIFKDWSNQGNPQYTPTFGTQSWPIEDKDQNWTRPSFRSPAYVKELHSRGLTRPKIPIKAIGVWDTVGILGVPPMKLLGIPIHTQNVKEYAFINTEVIPNLEYAYQALALDEQRAAFSPTLWEWPSSETSSLKLLKQTWFPGVHTHVGGGYDDASIADITLGWMITQLSRHLSFDSEYIDRQRIQNVAFYKSVNEDVRRWAMGLLEDSSTGFLNTLTGRASRSPGDYHRTDPDTGKPLPNKLRKTCEFIHPSVRYRIQQGGAGLSESDKDKIGKGLYKPKALSGWRFLKPGEQLDNEFDGKDWAKHGKWVFENSDGTKTVIVEETIDKGTAEMDLLKGWHDYGVESELDTGLNVNISMTSYGRYHLGKLETSLYTTDLAPILGYSNPNRSMIALILNPTQVKYIWEPKIELLRDEQMIHPLPAAKFQRKERPQSLHAGSLVLLNNDGSQTDNKFEINTGQSVVLGRSASKCHWHIADPFLSQIHLRIYCHSHEKSESSSLPLVFAEDLSKNGTYWNGSLMGRKKNDAFLLSDGDILHLSSRTSLCFRVVDWEDITFFDFAQEEEMRTFRDNFLITDRLLHSDYFSRTFMAVEQTTRTQLAGKIIDIQKFVFKDTEFAAGFDEIDNTATITHINTQVEAEAVIRRRKADGIFEKNIRCLFDAIDTLSSVRHPNIMSIDKIYLAGPVEDPRMYLFQPLATLGNLFSYMKSKNNTLVDAEAAMVVRQILMALDYLHNQGIVHQNLRPENIVVTSTVTGIRLMLTGLEFSRKMYNVSRTKNRVQRSPIFAEAYNRFRWQSNKSVRLGFASNMWSVGVISSFLATGSLPPRITIVENAKSRKTAENGLKILKSSVTFQHLQKQAKDFIRQLLVVDADKRISAIQALHHPWILGEGSGSSFDQLYKSLTKTWTPRISISPLAEFVQEKSPRKRTFSDSKTAIYEQKKRLIRMRGKAVESLGEASSRNEDQHVQLPKKRKFSESSQEVKRNNVEWIMLPEIVETDDEANDDELPDHSQSQWESTDVVSKKLRRLQHDNGQSSSAGKTQDLTRSDTKTRSTPRKNLSLKVARTTARNRMNTGSSTRGVDDSEGFYQTMVRSERLIDASESGENVFSAQLKKNHEIHRASRQLSEPAPYTSFYDGTVEKLQHANTSSLTFTESDELDCDKIIQKMPGSWSFD